MEFFSSQKRIQKAMNQKSNKRETSSVLDVLGSVGHRFCAPLRRAFNLSNLSNLFVIMIDVNVQKET